MFASKMTKCKDCFKMKIANAKPRMRMRDRNFSMVIYEHIRNCHLFGKS